MLIRLQATAEADLQELARAARVSPRATCVTAVHDRNSVYGDYGARIAPRRFQSQRVHEVQRAVADIRVAVPGLRVAGMCCSQAGRVGGEPAAPHGVVLPREEIVQRIGA